MFSDKLADAGLTVLQKAGQALAGTREGSDSLVGYTSAARVEPYCLIDASLLPKQDILPDVLQSMLAIFTGYYLQAWALSANVGDIEVIKQLERLNPSRNGRQDLVGLAAGDALGLEAISDFTHRLPYPGDPRNHEDQLALEAEHGDVGKDPGAELRQLTNLSVGKLINVSITGENGKVVTIPVSIRLLTNGIDPRALVHILSAGSKDTSFKERVYQYKSGEIQFFRDLVLCQDLIDEHKKHLSNDQTGFYAAILNRRTNNAVSSALTGNFSVATASNLVVMDSETQIQVELNIGGRLKDYKTRQKIFEKSYLMIMAVIDSARDRVTFFHRGIPEATNVSLRDIKASNKGSGPDVSDILAAFRVGSSPSF